MQTVTFMDAAGNVAQYTVYDANGHGQYHWTTDQGDKGSEKSEALAQSTARSSLKASMALRLETDQVSRYRSEAKRIQRAVGKVELLAVNAEKAPEEGPGPEGEITHPVRWRLGRSR
jgi:hypothetical protein